ncbi:MAG: phosphatidylinositol synthase, partial [Acidimicrobiales bacterium]|nr:phosphatidylinositol synthase [Acidimicrobiales bacterium]
MFDGRWRAGAERTLKPVGEGLRRTGISADHLTGAGLVLAAAAAVAIGSGHLGWGAGLFIASAVPDMLDGAVAKASGTASPRGAYFDSVIDRATDLLVLGGVAWHLASGRHPRDAVLAYAVAGAATLISYQRAKAESLGYSAKGGLMERAERIIVLSFALVFSSALIPVLWVLLVLSTVTAVQRFFKVWRQASTTVAVRPPGRWRAWRTAAADGERPARW